MKRRLEGGKHRYWKSGVTGTVGRNNIAQRHCGVTKDSWLVNHEEKKKKGVDTAGKSRLFERITSKIRG